MKIKKKLSKTPEVEVDNEKPFKEDDTEEIHNFIKELGLDKFTHETLDADDSNSGAAVKIKKKIKSKPEAIAPVGDKVPSAQPKAVVASKGKQNYAKSASAAAETTNGFRNGHAPPMQKKFQPVPDFQPSSRKDIEKQGFIAPAGQNKKIVFDKEAPTEAEAKAARKEMEKQGAIAPGGQNKKIVFDESYIVNSSDSAGGAPDKEAWYNLLIRPDLAWYQQGKKLKADGAPASPEEIKKCEDEARRYLEEDTANFQKVRAIGAEKSESRWMQTVLKSGAFTDKIAAHTLLLQESAPHNLTSLKYLISLLDVKGRRECLASLDALLRLFTEGRILNPSGKLQLFNKQPIGALRTAGLTLRERKEVLALWSFEHQLKDYYNQFILALDGLLKDAVDTTRRKTISALSTLLAYSPEQEQGLLSRLVNKVGDPTRAVATSAVAQMERLLQQHGNMKTVVVSEVERLLYRPNINTKAQYYALCFLSQILLDEEDVQLAVKLVVIYVSFFKACVKKGNVDSKLMAALLTGVKRAFPYTKNSAGPGGSLESHVDTLFKLVHMVKFSLGVQVLCILDQVVVLDQGNADRFYSVLFRKLFDANLATSTRQSMFLNLLFRALKRDESLPRLRSFLKRILQVCLSCPPQLSCGFLYLVSEILKIRPSLRVFPKEIKQYVADDDEDDEEEHFKDIDGDDEEGEPEAGSSKQAEEKEKALSSTWIHRKNVQSKATSRMGYDAMARNPIFGRAEQSGGLWEMNPLTTHFHPSVALFANTIVEGTPIDYTGDPLQDFTLVRFLDRFVFRNPKQVPTSLSKGPAQRRVLGKRNTYAPQGVRAMAVDSKQFIQQPQSRIPADEMFLYQYFKQRSGKNPKARKEKGDDKDDDEEIGSDFESVADEEFDEYLAQSADFDFAADLKGKPKADKTKKKKKEDDEEDDEEEEGGADSDLEAAEMDSDEDFEGDEEFQDAFKDFDDMLNDTEPVKEDGDEPEDDGDSEEGFNEEDAEFSDDESEAEVAPKTKSVKDLVKSIKSKKRTADDAEDDLDWAFEADEPSSNSAKRKKRKKEMFGDSDGLDFVAAEDFAAMLESNAGTGLNTAGTTEALANKDKASVKQLQWEMNRDRWMKDSNRPRRGGNKKGRGGFGGGGKGRAGGSKSNKSRTGAAFRLNRSKRGGK